MRKWKWKKIDKGSPSLKVFHLQKHESSVCCYFITYFNLREINHSVVIVLLVHENLDHPSNKVDFGCEYVALLPPSSLSITDSCFGKSLNIH